LPNIEYPDRGDASYSSDGSFDGSPPPDRQQTLLPRGRGDGLKSLQNRLVDQPEDEEAKMMMQDVSGQQRCSSTGTRTTFASLLRGRGQRPAKENRDDEEIASVFGAEAVVGLRGGSKRWPWNR